MASDRAWVSQAFMDTTIVRYLLSEGYIADPHREVEIMNRNVRGVPMSAEHFPKEIYGEYRTSRIKKLPDLCNAGDTWLVSAALAGVLREFDLGRTSLYPTKVLQFDRKTPVEGEYLCINFGERKASFLPEESPKAKRVYPDQDIWKLSLDPKDDDVVLGAGALEGPDLWLEEPRFTKAFFLSDRLVRALRDAKLARHFGLRRCRVIDPPQS